MYRTLHRVAIDIYTIPYRGCRPYQEKIADYGTTGRPLFEWDKMRERYFIRGTPAIKEICEKCPMNIFGNIEGCQGEVEGLTIFLKVLLHLKPDSTLFRYRYQQDQLSHEETRSFLNELGRVHELLQNTEWPIAQVFVDGEAKQVDGPRQVLYYEWEGDDDDTFVFSNDGYSVGIAKEGLVVKDASGRRQPYLFQRLVRTYADVSGETMEGQVIHFDTVRDAAPAWDDEPSLMQTELVYTICKGTDLFGDFLQVLSTVAEVALRHNTGIKLMLLN
ncbi:MAG TPA: hypothetical protein VGO93_09180 [Candidatus Xenobia bacterium]